MLTVIALSSLISWAAYSLIEPLFGDDDDGSAKDADRTPDIAIDTDSENDPQAGVEVEILSLIHI